MRSRWLFAALAVVAAACSADSNQTPTSPGTEPSFDLGQGLGGPQPHLFLMRGQAHVGGAASSPLMNYHGGDIIKASKTMAIFWGSWGSPGDKISGMDAFFSGFGGTTYAGTLTEYTGIGDKVSTTSIYLGHVVDGSSPPKHPQTSQVLAEACRVTGNNPDPAALYVVYSSTRRGGANYCAYHTWGSCSGKPVQAAWVFNLDGDAGCDPRDASGLHSQGLAAIANVTAHELSETVTDPRGTTWYDASGAENGDKCAWTFGPTVSSNPNQLSTFGNGSKWKLQGEWSNAAYTAGTGYPNSAGQKGCLAGY